MAMLTPFPELLLVSVAKMTALNAAPLLSNVILATLNGLLDKECVNDLPGVLSCDKLDNGDISIDSYNAKAPMGWTID